MISKSLVVEIKAVLQYLEHHHSLIWVKNELDQQQAVFGITKYLTELHLQS